jgi:hypothetical protein
MSEILWSLVAMAVAGGVMRGIVLWLKDRKDNVVPRGMKSKVSAVLRKHFGAIYKIGLCFQLFFLFVMIAVSHEISYGFLYGVYAFVGLASPVWFVWLFKWVFSRDTYPIWTFFIFLAILYSLNALLFEVLDDWYDFGGDFEAFIFLGMPAIYLIIASLENLKAPPLPQSQSFWGRDISFKVVTLIIFTISILAFGFVAYEEYVTKPRELEARKQYFLDR